MVHSVGAGYREESLLGMDGEGCGIACSSWALGMEFRMLGRRLGPVGLQRSLLTLLTPGRTWLLGLQAYWLHLPRQRQG